MTTSLQERHIRIPAIDGYSLAATVQLAEQPTKRMVVINSATATPRGFYRRFATALNAAGFDTLIWDYRGIGDSAPRSLRGFEARMRDWVALDMEGVIDWTIEEFGPDRLFLVGHSVGGQLAGMLTHPERINAMVTMSAQSGHWRLQGGAQRLAVLLHAYVTLPALSALIGYMPWRWVGGEDLPKGVAQEWGRWCRDPNYLLGDPTLPLDRYARFEAPVLAYSIDDDNWGTAAAVNAMVGAYPNVTRRHVSPRDIDRQSIGHFGFFRTGSEPLWSDVIDWLDAQ